MVLRIAYDKETRQEVYVREEMLSHPVLGAGYTTTAPADISAEVISATDSTAKSKGEK